jgi:hypothetical protein
LLRIADRAVQRGDDAHQGQREARPQ